MSSSTQRYLVKVSAAETENQPTILIAFDPQTFITDVVDKIWRRLRLYPSFEEINPATHIAAVHINSFDGHLIDPQTLLADVIHEPLEERLYIVITQKNRAPSADGEIKAEAEPARDHNGLRVRIVQPSDPKDRKSCISFPVSPTDTIQQLHDTIAIRLGLQPSAENVDSNECNCVYGKKIAEGPSELGSFVVIHGKSIVERLPLATPSSGGMQSALDQRFGARLRNKNVTIEAPVPTRSTNSSGSSMNLMPVNYARTPIAIICSKGRHVPIHARADHVGPTGRRRRQALDLHTSELPIHRDCYTHSIQDAGLGALAVDNVIDIFVVQRNTQGVVAALNNKSGIFAHQTHWEPRTVQTHRGQAMFLSSLRVFTSLFHEDSQKVLALDAMLHVFDQLTHFPPAVRCLGILCHGRTPTAPECSALSQAIYVAMSTHCSGIKNILGDNAGRIFEGSRLFFAFLLGSARSVRALLDDAGGTHFALRSVDLRDCKTMEPVFIPTQTSDGLVETSLFKAFQQGGVLADGHLQSFMTKLDIDPDLARAALLSGGTNPDIMILSIDKRGQKIELQLEMEQLTDLDHLAELCGQNKLAVHKPIQLASAIAPCLTFDRDAQLAVYTGEQPCAEAGRSSMIFRPLSGTEETIDPALIEQVIAPILRRYQDDGTAVFDLLGGAELKRMQEPHEIVMFCVDASSSMKKKSDFAVADEDNSIPAEPPVEDTIRHILASESHLPLADAKDQLLTYEGYDEMIAIIAAAPEARKEEVTEMVWRIFIEMLASDLARKAETLERKSQPAYRWHLGHHEVQELTEHVKQLKVMYLSMTTHKVHLVDTLRYSAQGVDPRKWNWSFGEAVPSESSFEVMPALHHDITDVPRDLLCPVGHTLMQEAVKAADGFTYNRSSIEKYFAMHPADPINSPMYRAPLQSRTLSVNIEVRQQVGEWIQATDLLGASQTDKSAYLSLTFNSNRGTFARLIPTKTTLADVYKLVFRGLEAKCDVFQLVIGDAILPPRSSLTLSSCGQIRDGDHIHVRIPEQTRAYRTISSTGSTTARQTSGVYLIKVYACSFAASEFSFWVREDITASLSLVIWKFWRYKFQHDSVSLADTKLRECWSNLHDTGDHTMAGTPEPSDKKLATFLRPELCTGQLGPEHIVRASNSSSGLEPTLGRIQNGNVLNLWIQCPDNKRKSARAATVLSRLDVLKQMFEALINRMAAYSYMTHVGLVAFASEAEVCNPITHVLENFRQATTELEANGDTALWDALNLARDQVKEYAERFPNAKKRIICISDGEDTKSRAEPSSLWRSLQQDDIVVDSVCLGDEYGPHSSLKTLTSLLGGYHFQPTSLDNAMSICEMEPFLALSQRPDIVRPWRLPRSTAQALILFNHHAMVAKPTVVTSNSVPPMKEHPNFRDDFVQLTALASKSRETTSNSTGTGNGHGNGNVAPGRLRTHRLMTEIKAMAAGHPMRDVYISTADMSFWKIVMQGPEDSPYAGGRFLMYLHADDFPVFAPKVRFVTPIKHPNVNPHGRICHTILYRDWTSDTSITAVLDTIYGLLYQPEYENPVNTTITLDYHHDQVEFAELVRDHVKTHASRSRDEWKAIILGEVPESADEAEDDNENDDDGVEDNGEENWEENEDGHMEID